MAFSASAITTTFKQNPESTKHPSSYSFSSTSLATQKSCSISNKRHSSILRFDASLEPSNVDFRKGNYISLLEECIGNNSLSDAQVVHAHIVKTGAHVHHDFPA